MFFTDKKTAASHLKTATNEIKIDTNKGEVYYKNLYDKCQTNLNKLQAKERFAEEDFYDRLEEEGIQRRDFLKWVSATTAALMLPGSFEPLVAQTIEVINRTPVIWANFQDCAGNSEAFLRTDGPTIDELILDIISLEFHELLMTPSGEAAEAQLADAMATFKGEYLLFVEGSIPTLDNGVYGTIGSSGETYMDHITRLAQDCAAVVAVGSCATFGGVPSAAPNPTGAKGVMDVISGKNIVNIPACPANPSNMLGVILLYTMTGELPELDHLLRPKFAFGTRIHDVCERRVHFDAGEFVEEWGDANAQDGHCLYKMGCKGPFTFNNCPTVQYNRETSWPVAAGHGCIGCSEPGFIDKFGSFEKPFVYNPSYNPASDISPVVNIATAAFLVEIGKVLIAQQII
ncbi:MAG: hydrogenase small subunit, partial [Sulfurimonas sp.]|nr:hydrogenase small subunit [Sulfurimonas sp.]